MDGYFDEHRNSLVLVDVDVDLVDVVTLVVDEEPAKMLVFSSTVLPEDDAFT